MTLLWTFENPTKLEQFAAVLRANDIRYEIGSPENSTKQVCISVDEKDYPKARKVLMKHRKRRTSGDYK